jgi:polyribonucleotide nucleotidyltransferase
VVYKVERAIAGRTLSLESGRIAKQADGAVLVQYGETIVLVTAVAEPMAGEGPDFFPLTVEYREKQYAAGKFPGGVIKREGRPTTKEILTMRLIDRPLRPLFPEDYREEVQVIATVLSADQQNDPDMLAMVGASAALAISDIPFPAPIGAVRVGLVDDEFVINPTHEQRERSELEIVVASTESAVVMVEGSARIIPEEDVLTAIRLAHDVNVQIAALIKELTAKCGKQKRKWTALPSIEPVIEKIEARFGDRFRQAVFTPQKLASQDALKALCQEAIQTLCKADDPNAPSERDVKRAWPILEGRIIRRRILEEGKRCDGRGPDDLREITCEVGVLPRTHGSALFTRGETQALVIATLGTVTDEQRVLDALVEEEPRKFMVHYNFPPFCVGEVKPIRGPGRREIGHGELVERALQSVLPKEEVFPYTIRLVSDIMESNGSSSMASVCGGTLCMMDAGIPISDPVAGVAMGLVMDKGKRVILTDICGAEDHFGDMDLKLAGTQNGVTALQLDLKVTGVDWDTLAEAIAKAKNARMRILRTMLQTLRMPRPTISPYAPILRLLKIDPEKIGLLIGPGGKTIRGLEERFKCEIEVEDDGTVTVSTSKDGNIDGIVAYIESMTRGGLEVGKTYDGVVSEIKDFGAIVEIFPGTDGLCHISELSDEYVRNVADVCKVGDKLRVKVLSIDGNKVKLSRKAVLREEKARAESAEKEKR